MLKNNFQIKQPTCPWWFLFTFDNPLRKIYQDPFDILVPFIREGDTVVDLGCGMGYFSLPMASLVGESGKVIAVDLQSQMLNGLKRRAEKAGLQNRIQLHNCTQDQIGISEPVDFVLAFWMVHEVHEPRAFFEQIREMLHPGGQLLIAEPYIHVTRIGFERTLAEVIDSGFSVVGSVSIGFSRSILAQKDH